MVASTSRGDSSVARFIGSSDALGNATGVGRDGAIMASGIATGRTAGKAASGAEGGRVVAGRGSGGPAAGREVGDRTAATVHAAAGRAGGATSGRAGGTGAGRDAGRDGAAGAGRNGGAVAMPAERAVGGTAKLRAGADSCTMRTDQPGPAPSSSSYDDSPQTGGSRKVTTGRPSAPWLTSPGFSTRSCGTAATSPNESWAGS